MDMYVFLYLFILIYNLFHPGKFFFHVFHQFELCSATIQIMTFPMYLKVMISLQRSARKRIPHSKVIRIAPIGAFPPPDL